MIQTRKKRANKTVKLKKVKSPPSSTDHQRAVKEEDTLCQCKRERGTSSESKVEPSDSEAKPKVQKSGVKPRVASEAPSAAKKEEEGELKVEENLCSCCGAQLEGYSNAIEVPTSSQGSEQQTADHTPVKRRRLVMEAVELPATMYTTSRASSTTPLQMTGRAPSTPETTEAALSQDMADTEFEELMKEMKNPKVKKKKEAFNLSLDSLKDRLLPIGIDPYPTGLGKDISETYFYRQFISEFWGGGPQETFPHPRKELLARHGLDDWMCITLNHHPHGPEIPGAPGLYFKPGLCEDDPKNYHPDPYRVLVRIESGKWQYMGQYAMTRSKFMTKAEWASQSVKCRNAWAYEIYSKVWAIRLRAEAYLIKRLLRKPTKDEIRRELQFRQSEVQKKTAYHNLVTIEDISSAISDGLIPVGVYTMKCIDYDKKFAQEVHEKWPNWEEEERRKKEQKAQAVGPVKRPNRKETKASSRSGNKRKRVDESDEEDVDLISEGEDEEIDERESPYKSKGTRTRPIIL